MENRTPVQQDARQVASNGKLLTILGTTARIEGKFQIAESIEVQCEITGELNVGGTLVIGDRGHVSADVTTLNAVVIGSYSGNLKASGSVEIAASGRVSGSIESNELVIAKGAVFTGNVSHTERGATRAQATAQPSAQPSAQPFAQPSAFPSRQQPQIAPQQQEPVLVEPGIADAPLSAAIESDIETAIPVARLVELDVSDGARHGETGATRASNYNVS